MSIFHFRPIIVHLHEQTPTSEKTAYKYLYSMCL
jgi:hypothetical protein